MVDIDIDAMGIPGPEGIRCGPWSRSREKKKRTPYIRSETEKSKKPEACPKKGAHDGT
jgi:hypothetical protein